MVHLSLLADEIIKRKTGPAKEKQQPVPAASASYLLHHTCSNIIYLFPDFDLVCPPEFHTFGSVKVIEMGSVILPTSEILNPNPKCVLSRWSCCSSLLQHLFKCCFFFCRHTSASGRTEVCVITGQKSSGDKDPKLQVWPDLFWTSPAVKQAGIFFSCF